uniref:RSE1/DDB1/CPSF1 first beta-propeller domain-containing protein n=1 Tax=Geospiza parvula TaxID=87175 RepID=A0A8U8APF1_GEOPR
MYAVYKQTHPPTGLEFSLYCHFFSAAERNLVVAGTSQLFVYRLNHEPEAPGKGDRNGEGKGQREKLELLGSFSFFGNVMSMASVQLAGAKRDALLLSFKDAKLSVVEYDPGTHDLKTLSLHYFEEPELRDGFVQNVHTPCVHVGSLWDGFWGSQIPLGFPNPRFSRMASCRSCSQGSGMDFGVPKSHLGFPNPHFFQDGFVQNVHTPCVHVGSLWDGFWGSQIPFGVPKSPFFQDSFVQNTHTGLWDGFWGSQIPFEAPKPPFFPGWLRAERAHPLCACGVTLGWILGFPNPI